MGIDISAKLIYGLPYSELPKEILDEVDEMLDNGDLDYASPYYDAPRDEWIVGVEIVAWKKGHYDLGYEIYQVILSFATHQSQME
jgi:hypothetical protein